MTRLSIERILSSPPLSGLLPTATKLSPDGRWVSYLRPADDDRQRMDLWGISTADNLSRCLVDARALPRGALSEEEKARRERKRVFGSGIVEYEWSRDAQSVIAPYEGRLMRISIADGGTEALTPEGTQQTDARLSPDGQRIAYVRNGDIFVYDFRAKSETRLTEGGSDSLTNGLAEFIAQEEMHRFEGFWWSPDSQRIAYTRVDHSPVPITYRHDIEANGIRIVPQRYPYAGAANARVDLCVVRIDQPLRPTTLTWRKDQEDYLARVSWLPNNRGLVVTRQSRDQRRVDLVRLDLHSGGGPIMFTETSPSWINLNNNLKLLADGRYLFTSEQDGFSHVYRASWQDVKVPPHQLTSGPWMINQILGTTQDAQEAICIGWSEDPCQQQGYAVNLCSGERRSLTLQPGWHQLTLAAASDFAIDQWSSPEQPPCLELLDLRSLAAKAIAANRLDANHPYTAYREEHPTIQSGFIAAGDGTPLYYRLTLPNLYNNTKKAPWPTLLAVYGGPGVTRARWEWIPLWHQFLARQGVAILELDNRGSELRGRAFESVIHGCLGKHEVEDQLCAVEWIRQQPLLDGSRIAVSGHSYGGFMTLMLLSQSPRTFCCGIASAPVCDWQLYDTHYTERYLGTPQGNPEGYSASNVLSHIQGLHDPLLLIHGMADDNVLFTNTTNIMKALQDRNVDFEFMAYPGSKHGLAEPTVARHRYELMFRFLSKHLRLKETP